VFQKISNLEGVITGSDNVLGGLEVSGRGLIDQFVWTGGGEGGGSRTMSRVFQPRSSSANLVNTSATVTSHLSSSNCVKTLACYPLVTNTWA
jgi:hypothetical protein